jgi:hypothetical protein
MSGFMLEATAIGFPTKKIQSQGVNKVLRKAGSLISSLIEESLFSEYKRELRELCYNIKVDF